MSSGSRSVTIPQAMEIALGHHQAGELQKAEEIYRQVLAVEPRNPDALHLLGITGLQTGNIALAAEVIAKAVQVEPSNPHFQNSLGNAYTRLNRHAEAESCFRRAVEIDPGNYEAHNNLGIVLKILGRFEDAERSCRQALAVAPDYAEAHNSLGNTLVEMGRAKEAEQCFGRALALRPDYAEAHNNLGNALVQLGRLREAEQSYRDALALKADYAEAHHNLGRALSGMERLDEAEQCYRRSLAIRPDYAKAHFNLGNALLERGRTGEAEQCYLRALAINPEYAEAHCNIGMIRTRSGQLEEARDCYRRALALKADFAEAHSNLIMALDLVDGCESGEQQEERRRWHERHAQMFSGSVRPHDNAPDPGKRLRVGYVSADFHRHSASHLFGPIIRAHDRGAFEVICYSGTGREDEVTAALKRAAGMWRSTVGVSDDGLVEIIRRDEVDILVDLSGHTRGNRLLVFARKPAPIQVTAWGYATGTGLPAIDCFFADPVLVPPEERQYFAEEVIDLPCCLCYEAPQYAPEVSAMPRLAGQPFTFGCLNRVEKISHRNLVQWARILAALPAARLLIKDRGLDDEGNRARLLSLLDEHGIAGEKVRLLGGTSHAEHLGSYREIDLALDPFPHGGGVSTLEALWMGVPVVTLAGVTVPSRLSASILTALGMQEWIAHGDEEFVQKALDAARSPRELGKLRGQLRPRMAASILGDAQVYTRAVEETYRSLWRRWCERSGI